MRSDKPERCSPGIFRRRPITPTSFPIAWWKSRREQHHHGDTGDVTVWQTDGHGATSAITSLGPLPTGFHIFGTGNFNDTTGDDILFRNSWSLAIRSTSGIGVGSPVVIGITSATCGASFRHRVNESGDAPS